MLIESTCIPKRLLTTVSESCSLEDALTILEESGFRCVPILDETERIFRGNIYKMHIYRHKANGGDMTLPVTHLLKNSTKFVHLNSSFFNIFFTIKELPYIAVLDSNNLFYGILTHSSLLNILSQSWNVKEGRFALTVASTGKKGDLTNMTKIISKYSDIASCITLDVGKDEYIRRTIITLPANTTDETCETIVKALEKKDFFVAEIEDLSITIQ
ncbi:MAG: cyclic di-AMP binding protein CbpA [Vagococcus sp.]